MPGDGSSTRVRLNLMLQSTTAGRLGARRVRRRAGAAAVGLRLVMPEAAPDPTRSNSRLLVPVHEQDRGRDTAARLAGEQWSDA